MSVWEIIGRPHDSGATGSPGPDRDRDAVLRSSRDAIRELRSKMGPVAALPFRLPPFFFPIFAEDPSDRKALAHRDPFFPQRSRHLLELPL